MEVLNVFIKRNVEQSFYIANATPFSIEVLTNSGALSYKIYLHKPSNKIYIKNNLPTLYDGKPEDAIYVRRTCIEEIFTMQLVQKLYLFVSGDKSCSTPERIKHTDLKIYFYELLRLELITEKMIGAALI